MKKGYLSGYFSGIAAKKLSAVEADPEKSNQHELNGVSEIKKILGTEKISIEAKFVYLDDELGEPLVDQGTLRWYDSREKNLDRSAEYRLYYPSNSVTEKLKAGDLFVFAQKTDGTAMFITVSNGSTLENQIIWLFGLDSEKLDIKYQTKIVEESDKKLDFASRFILEELDVETFDLIDDDDPHGVIEKFGTNFPKTFEFSQFAREVAGKVSAIEAPDETLITWIEKEEELFRRLEKHIATEKIKNGFDDVDSFVEVAKSILNRRKSRVGYCLEHHLSQIFSDNQITFSNGKITENKAKPDFLFPSVEHYHTVTFPPQRLTMLGAKTSCKDRWRQVLSEAERIPFKHLITLQPGISTNQTGEMKAHNLQLILPQSIHETYSLEQQKHIINLKDFIDLVKSKQ
jgi:hypothetical protein